MKKFKRRKICIVSSTRADLGILSEVIKSIQKDKSFDTKLLLTGSHLEEKYGSTFQEALKKNKAILFPLYESWQDFARPKDLKVSKRKFRL